VRLGLLLPQGYFNEFDGWQPDRAWARVVEVAREAERRGFDSVWLGEHVLAKWNDAGPAFDCVALAAALAAVVPRVEIGFTVVNSTFRNPAMTAKAAGTIDAVSGGRLVLGLGAGFKPREAEAFGQPFPDLPERMAILEEHFEIISRMTRRDAGHFTYRGRHAWAVDGINSPATSGREHIPLLIGGHGRSVTFRIAARFCDELNINLAPHETPPYLEALAERCAEVGRDRSAWPLRLQIGTNPSTAYPGLRATGGQRMMGPGDFPTAVVKTSGKNLQPRAEIIRDAAGLGFDRFVCGVPGMANTFETLDELLEDAAAAGITLAPARAEEVAVA
jgi:alkanesulfonate monooxygenase SsuD/methylene tetrahydromethanopterin reductase-like flavin-dependent oxidoreductase (luciferase family)